MSLTLTFKQLTEGLPATKNTPIIIGVPSINCLVYLAVCVRVTMTINRLIKRVVPVSQKTAG